MRTILNAVGEGLAPPAAVFRRKLGRELASLVCTYFTYTVIPSVVEESPYKQICTNGDFSIPLPSVAPLEMTA